VTVQQIAHPGLALSYLSPPAVVALPAAERSRILGCVLYSADPEAARQLHAHGVTHVPLSLLGAGSAVCEVWTGGECASGEQGGISFRHDGEWLFGRMVVSEQSGLAPSMRVAYDRMLDLLEAQGYRTLLRIWNFVPSINDAGAGEERYRQFNRARHESFVDAGRSLADNVPAACALGLEGTAFPVVYFIASRGTAVPFENPRQVRASAYPREYGDRSPVFSRACLAESARQRMLFVSGTASILGHATQHPGDVVRQTRESLVNIDALLATVAQSEAGRRIGAQDLAYKVYVRNATDYPRVREVVQAAVGAGARMLYLQADICREDLLVEIEAAGGVAC